MNVVSFRDVALGHGQDPALVHATFCISEGDFVGLLGANGAGKTTLLRALLGLLPARRGSIEVFGAPPRRGNPRIGYVPQIGKTLSEVNLTGNDLLLSAAAGRRFGWPFATASDRKDVHQVLELAEAGDLACRPVNTLSSGERQRLLIAQAFLGRPSLLLLDEPLASLDPSHQVTIVALVRRLQRDVGMTVVMSSHEFTPLLGNIDGILYLGRKGIALGTVDEVMTAECLSQLYGAPIDVIRSSGRIFVAAAQAQA